MPKEKILITGADGQLGKELQEISAEYSGFEFFFMTRKNFAIDDPSSIRNFFQSEKPAYCINCAAYTAVDKAESESKVAFLINGEAVGELANACNLWKTKLIHISTDYVFDGNSPSPLKEDDITKPINVYGASKLQGELLAMANNKESIIIRTAWLYSRFGNNFVKTMIRLMKEKDSINVINDQVGTPTYAADLAVAIMKIVSSKKFIPGIFHYSNEGKISWYDFAVAIKEMTHSSCIVKPIPATQYPTPAKRPYYSLLDKTKIKATYNLDIPGWKASLEKCIDLIKKAAV